MTPATSSPVLRRHARRRAVSPLSTSATLPNDPRTFWREAFRAVRAETERRAAPLGRKTRSCSRCRTRARPNGIARTPRGSSSSSCSSPHLAGYRVFDERFAFLFNSYYVAAGPRHARPRRGLITRPDCARVAAYRAHVDAAVERLIATVADARAARRSLRILEIGLQSRAAASGTAADRHPARVRAEPDRARLRRRLAGAAIASRRQTRLRRLPAGIHTIGFDGDGYCFDNEGPAHQVFIAAGAHRAQSRHQCAVARVHRRRRLRDAVALALRRLGDGRGRRLEGAGLLARDRRRMVHADARRPQAGRSATRRSRMSAITRPTPSRAGPASTCRPRPNGRSRRAPACSTTRSASLGNGRAAPICPIRAIAPPTARSANTTASS